jgi:hypothetical protein
LRVEVFRFVDFRALAFRPVDFRAVDFRAVFFRPDDFRAVDLRAVFFRPVFVRPSLRRSPSHAWSSDLPSSRSP